MTPSGVTISAYRSPLASLPMNTRSVRDGRSSSLISGSFRIDRVSRTIVSALQSTSSAYAPGLVAPSATWRTSCKSRTNGVPRARSARSSPFDPERIVRPYDWSNSRHIVSPVSGAAAAGRAPSKGLLDLGHLNRAILLRGQLGGGEDLLGFVGVFEVGQGDNGRLAAEDLQDVGGFVDEGMFVADDVGVGPPGFGVGVAAAVGDQDLGPALVFAVGGAVVEVQP